MAAETENTLQKVDSLTDHQDGAAKKGHRRVSSMAADVYRIEDLGEYFFVTVAQMRGRA